MLIATITALILLFGGGSDAAGVKANVEIMQGLIEEHIDEDMRRAQVADVLQEMIQELEAFEQRAAELSKGIFDVDKNYEATAEDFRAVFKKINHNWESTQRRMVALRFEMHGLMRRDEWNGLFADLRKAIKKD